MFRVAAFALGPVLWWQVREVRKRSVALPEAEGPREGVAGAGKVCLRVLIVGDSAAAGVGAKNQTQALAGRLSEALSQRLQGSVVWQLIARSGDTTQDSLRALRTLSLHPADVMVTATGLNDMVAHVSTRRWLMRLDGLARVAARRAGVKQVIHCGIPPIHSFAVLPNPLRWVLGMDAHRYNRALAAWVQNKPARWWLPLPFENDQPADTSVLMAEDGLHPGPAVYALWAEQLAGLISGEIAPDLPETAPTRRRPQKGGPGRAV